MPTFKDRENIANLVPDGDYIVRVVAQELGVSKGTKTAGCDTYNLTLEVEAKPPNGGVKVYETLVDHEDIGWKFDVMLKCLGVALPKGSSYELDAERAAMAEATHVDLIGRRGWVQLYTDDYNGKKRSKVAQWYTNKPKVARVEPPAPEQTADGEF